QLLVILQAKLVTDVMADRFAKIVLEQREHATQDAGGQQGQPDTPQRALGRPGMRVRGQDALRLIDSVAQQSRNGELEDAGDDRRYHGQRALPWVAEGHAGNAGENVQAAVFLGLPSRRAWAIKIRCTR